MSKNNSPAYTVARILSLALLCLACGPALAQRGGREDRRRRARAFVQRQLGRRPRLALRD